MYTDLSKIWNVTLINSNLLGLQKKKKKKKKYVTTRSGNENKTQQCLNVT